MSEDAADMLSDRRTHHTSRSASFDVDHVRKEVDRIEWFTFSVTRVNGLWTDFYFLNSLLLQIGFLGFVIATFVVALQIENMISRVWILWIFYLIQTGLLFFQTLSYAYKRFTKEWINMSIHHIGRINISMFFMWTCVIFSIASLSYFLGLPVVPSECCTNDVVGLTTLPLNIPLFLQWQLLNVFLLGLNFGAFFANMVSITSQLYPERKMTREEIAHLPKVFVSTRTKTKF